MRLIAWLKLAIGVSGLALATSPASAQSPCNGGPVCNGCADATITVSDTEPSQVPPWTKTLMVPAFDQTLGTLVQVDVTATAPLDGFFMVENLDTQQGCLGGQWTIFSLLSVNFDNGGIPIFAAVPLDASGTFGPLAIFDGTLDYRGPSGETDPFSESEMFDECFDDPSVLQSFVGTAGQMLSFTGQTITPQESNNSGCGFLARIVKMNVALEITVNYRYCPNDPPQANPDDAETCEGVPVNIPVLANDTDPESSLDCGTVMITSLPSDGTVTVSPNCTGIRPCTGCVVTYTPDPGFSGMDSFAYVVLDVDGCASNEAPVTVDVHARPIALPDNALACQGQVVQIPILNNDTDPDGSINCGSIVITSPPASGTVVIGPSCTGTAPCAGCRLIYTPNPGSFGVDCFQYTVRDTDGCVSAPAMVCVDISANPVANPESATTCEGDPVAIPILANDVDPDGQINCGTIVIVSQPTGGTVSIGAGCTGPAPCPGCVVTYTPNRGFTGDDQFRYRVRDNRGCLSNTATVQLEVGASPILAPDLAQTCQGQPVAIDVLANDSDPDGVIDCGTIEIVSQPSNGTLLIGPGCTGSRPCPGCSITFTPNPSFIGTDAFLYRVSDATGCVSEPVQVSIEVSGRPIALPNQAQTCAGSSVQIAVLGNDTDPEGQLDCGSILISSPPTNGTVVIGGGCTGTAPCAGCFITYTPNANHSGLDSFSYTVADVDGCRSAPATVTVDTSANPIAQMDQGTTCQGVPVDIPILANDTDPDGQLACGSIQILSQPVHGTIVIGPGCTGAAPCPTCVVTYIPQASYFGSDQFTYRVADNRGCFSNPATVAITVHGRPVALGDQRFTCQGTTVSIPVLQNDMDPDGNLDCSSIAIVSKPQHGMVTIGAGCTGPSPCAGCVLIYVPDRDYFGLDQFQYTVQDLTDCTSNAATVTIDIGANPLGVADSGDGCQGDSVSIPVLANDSDPDGTINCGSIQIVQPPVNGTVAIGAGCTGSSCPSCVLIYTPNPNFVGEDLFRYRVADNEGCFTLPTRVVVTIITQPAVADDEAETCQGDCVDIAVLANDTPGIERSSIQIVQQPLHGGATVDLDTGEITYCPLANFCGSEDVFTYRIVANADCPSEVATVRVAVSCDPMAQDDQAEIDPDTLASIQIPVLANDSDPDGTLVPSSVTITLPPEEGTILSVDPTTGVVTYRPRPGFAGPDAFEYSVLDDDGCPAAARVVVTLELECPETYHRRRPGSLLLYPEFDNRSGVVSILTVTNSKKDTDSVRVKFIYRNKDNCLQFDRSETLTPNDTLSLITNFHNATQVQGYVYAYAVCPTGGAAIAYNHLIGNLLIVDGLESFSYAVNPVAFEGIGGAPGTACPGYPRTDLDGDGIRDLNGLEYTKAPDQLLIPRFLGQIDDLRSDLVLIGLSGGPLFDTTLDFLIYDDNEHAFSDELTFNCWTRIPLLEISGAFSNEFLHGLSDTDPEEVLGQPDQESGWIRIDGGIAQSNTTVIQDPAFYAVLIECVADGRYVAELPFELCTQDNGDLLPYHINGDITD